MLTDSDKTTKQQNKSVSRGVAQLVAHLVWDQGVAGSNPVTPTIKNSLIVFKTIKEFFIVIIYVRRTQYMPTK